MLLRDSISSIGRCCKCNRLIHPLDDYCQVHWEEYLNESRLTFDKTFPGLSDETDIEAMFWSLFNLFIND